MCVISLVLRIVRLVQMRENHVFANGVCSRLLLVDVWTYSETVLVQLFHMTSSSVIILYYSWYIVVYSVAH